MCSQVDRQLQVDHSGECWQGHYRGPRWKYPDAPPMARRESARRLVLCGLQEDVWIGSQVSRLCCVYRNYQAHTPFRRTRKVGRCSKFRTSRLFTSLDYLFICKLSTRIGYRTGGVSGVGARFTRLVAPKYQSSAPLVRRTCRWCRPPPCTRSGWTRHGTL